MRAAERDRSDVKAERAAWPKNAGEIPVRNLVFVDESAASTSMTRLYGRSPVGERVTDSAPLSGWHSFTMLSAIRLDGPLAPLLLDGPLDGESFAAWLEQMLIPALRPDDVVVMDNLPTHRVRGVSRLLEKSRHGLLYLPPYSPDLNPIEEMWSKVKSILRSLKARTWDELLPAMDRALKAVTKSDCDGYFRHCGYRIN
jgi:transposase